MCYWVEFEGIGFLVRDLRLNVDFLVFICVILILSFSFILFFCCKVGLYYIWDFGFLVFLLVYFCLFFYL